MKKQMLSHAEIVVYQSKAGAIELRQNAQTDTVWANQAHIADIFEVERSVVTKHIRNILNDKELDVNSVRAKFAHTADDGKTYQVQFYNLDVILAVGYRTNSKRAIAFRQWATKVLKQHIIDGYTINRKRIKINYDKFLKAVADVKQLLPNTTAIDNEAILELITLFAETWFSLDAYDKDALIANGSSKKKVKLTAKKLMAALVELKQTLVMKNEATDIFGTERTPDNIESIVGNVMQGFAGQDVYPTVEEKAAHLLYFIIKNHPFIDGNKRSGAYAFIWFLQQAKILNLQRMTPPALTALTLLIAESKPSDKDKMVALVCNLLCYK